VDCNLKFQQAQELVQGRLERQHNVLMDQMDMISGIPSIGGRYPVRKPIVMSGSTFNTVHIEKSNVGVVNTGSIRSVEVSLTCTGTSCTSASASNPGRSSTP
jgi:hypothetical protein